MKYPDAEHPIIILTEPNIIDIKILVFYMYTGELVITNDSSPTSLLRAAQILKIDSLTANDIDVDAEVDTNNSNQDQQLPTQQQHQPHQQLDVDIDVNDDDDDDDEGEGDDDDIDGAGARRTQSTRPPSHLSQTKGRLFAGKRLNACRTNYSTALAWHPPRL